jgi:hypothetical protein
MGSGNSTAALVAARVARLDLLLQADGDQIVLRGEAAVQRRLRHAGLGDDLVNPDGADATLVE